MNRKRLMYLTDSIGFGGAEGYMVDLAKYFQNQYRIYVSLPETIKTKEIQNHLSNDKVIIKYTNFNTNKILVLFRTLQLVLKFKPEITHVILQNPLSSFIPLLTLSFIPKIKAIVTFQLVTDEYKLGYRRKKIYRFIFKNMTLIATSKNNQEILSNRLGIPLDRIKLIPNGARVELEKVMTNNEKLLLKKQLNILNKKYIFIFPARISKQKDHLTLIEAVKKLPSNYKNKLSFLLAGDIKDEEDHYNSLCDLVTKYQLSDVILFLGHRTDIKFLLQISDFFILSTNYEGQPFSLLEAMSIGLPVIVSDVSGIGEIVKHEQNGLLFSKNNVEELRSCIMSVINNSYDFNKIAKEAKEIANLYSKENMTLKTENIYNQLLLIKNTGDK